MLKIVSKRTAMCKKFSFKTKGSEKFNKIQNSTNMFVDVGGGGGGGGETTVNSCFFCRQTHSYLVGKLMGQPPPPFQPLRNGPEDREILKY